MANNALCFCCGFHITESIHLCVESPVSREQLYFMFTKSKLLHLIMKFEFIMLIFSMKISTLRLVVTSEYQEKHCKTNIALTTTSKGKTLLQLYHIVFFASSLWLSCYSSNSLLGTSMQILLVQPYPQKVIPSKLRCNHVLYVPLCLFHSLVLYRCFAFLFKIRTSSMLL